MFNPIVVSNIINQQEQQLVYKNLTEISFPWHYVEDVTFENHQGSKSVPGFANLIYHHSNKENIYCDRFKFILENLVNRLNISNVSLMRIRAGFLLKSSNTTTDSKYSVNIPHRDFDEEHYVAVYYVNDSDGPTLVYNEIEQSSSYTTMFESHPVQGNIVVFNGWHYHSSCSPIHNQTRLALTFNFKGKINV